MLLDRRLTEVRPAARQQRTQELEFYAFFHFTVNTFTNREWGDGTESPSIFSPDRLDAEQWVRAVKAAGMKGAILTCKHHDGFCLWPSRYTDHSVAASPYRDGKGDVVREVAQACRKEGLAFGVYLSPWDRHEATYGQGKPYDDYFVNQLTELLTEYGPVFAVWFDGACGEGPNGKKQEYDWERYYETVRRLQPEACMHVCGPDIRWCGNEAGDTRESEWSVVPARMAEAERTAAKSQQEDSEAFRETKITSMDADLGSRQRLAEEKRLIWYPAEVDMSIRPGWFWHPEENEKVHSLEHLLRVYVNSVGGNATLLLNVPPTTEGRIHEKDEVRLRELGEKIRLFHTGNLLEEAVLQADTQDRAHPVDGVRKEDYEDWFSTEEGVSQAEITVTFPEEKKISCLRLKEQNLLGQRIERFEIIALEKGVERKVYEGTTVGYQKIAWFSPVETSRLRIRILDARGSVNLAFLGIYAPEV